MTRRERIWAKLMARTTVLPCGCYRWDGPDSGAGRGGGYGRFSCDGATMATHIAGWTVQNGPIPPKKQLDHTCRCCDTGRRCWCPDHLELVTHLRNQRRRAQRAKEQSNEPAAKAA
jgi:hypothetical protein